MSVGDGNHSVSAFLPPPAASRILGIVQLFPRSGSAGMLIHLSPVMVFFYWFPLSSFLAFSQQDCELTEALCVHLGISLSHILEKLELSSSHQLAEKQLKKENQDLREELQEFQSKYNSLKEFLTSIASPSPPSSAASTVSSPSPYQSLAPACPDFTSAGVLMAISRRLSETLSTLCRGFLVQCRLFIKGTAFFFMNCFR